MEVGERGGCFAVLDVGGYVASPTQHLPPLVNEGVGQGRVMSSLLHPLVSVGTGEAEHWRVRG